MNIWTFTGIVSGNTNPLAVLGTLTFTNAEITGLRLHSTLPVTPFIGFGFHWFNGTTEDMIIFNDASAPIPEPTTIALLGIGLVGLAGVGIRRRLKKTNSNDREA